MCEVHDDDLLSSKEEDSRRRSLIQRGIAIGASLGATPAAIAKQDFLVPNPPSSPQFFWPLGKVAFSLLPLAGTSTRRATVEEEIVKDTIWTHDQIQGVVNVNVPVRQTVIRLKSGGLFVHNPVAPTPQLLQMMDRLVQQYGPVKHIVLASVAVEHKATFPAFASKFPQATVWVQPGQWSFPLNVPIELYGLVQRGRRLREIPVPGRPATKPQYETFAQKDPVPEWAAEIDYEVLGPLRFRSVGAFSETVFYHRATRTMLVTDTVCSLTQDPPAILQEDPRALLFHARDYATQRIEDTPEVRRKGWRRMAQFGLVFFPSQIEVRSVSEALQEAAQIPPELQNLGQGAVPGGKLYPWAWKSGDGDRVNFEEISQNGKLFCPPILTKLILDREPTATLEFVDRVSKRFKDMQRIIPCHLNNNVRVNGSREWYEAFDPIRSRPDKLVPQRALAEDLALLQKASDLLTQAGVVGPSLVCDGEPARRKGRFATTQR